MPGETRRLGRRGLESGLEEPGPDELDQSDTQPPLRGSARGGSPPRWG